jgi:hypothetical protein
VTGTAALGGTLSISFIDGFAPRAGQQFTVLTAAGATIGQFASIEILGLAPGFSYSALPNAAGALVLTAQNDGVAISPPRLQIARGAGSTVISWPAGGNWTLESSQTLHSASWQSVTTAPTATNGRFSLTLSTTLSNAYYRLRK